MRWVFTNASKQVIGQMTSSVTEVLDFVQISETLWDASSPSSSSSPSKLVGSHSWPFSLTLPAHCQMKSSNGEEQSYRLPGSFSERMARVHIQYQVLVTVHRSRFRVDSKCVLSFFLIAPTSLPHDCPFSRSYGQTGDCNRIFSTNTA